MLKQILQKMASGAVYSQVDLAKCLDISEDLLSRMLKDLARKGYLTPLASDQPAGCDLSGGSHSCKTCSAGCALAKKTKPRGWTLTAKGHASARQRPA